MPCLLVVTGTGTNETHAVSSGSSANAVSNHAALPILTCTLLVTALCLPSSSANPDVHYQQHAERCCSSYMC